VLGGLPANGIPNNKVLEWFKLASYNLDAQFFSVLSDTVIVYDQGTTARFQQTINNYDYNRKNFQLQRKVTSVNSKNEVITQNFTYPPDYTVLSTNNTTGRSIYNLQNKGIISVPIEQYSTRIKNGVEYVINGKLNVYKNDLPAIDAVYNLETNGTTPMSNFQTSRIDGNNNLIFHAAYVRRLNQSKYTDKGMVAEVNKQDDSKLAYIWDYKGLKLIAEVKNADIPSVAYTSFEADGAGSWEGIVSPRVAGGVTGKQCYQLSNGAIVRNNLNAGSVYTISYWSTGGPYSVSGSTGSVVQGKTSVISGVAWTYYEHQVAGVSSVTVSGSSNIDELRLYPKDALMQTFTHDPLIGITSQCDARSNITYFEYDGLSRLLRMRDADKKILKQYDYQYQVTSHTGIVWGPTGNTRCKPCAANGNYTTNMLQREEKNINPNGPAATRWVDDNYSSNCVITPDWQYTGNSYCVKNSNGTNTGILRREQHDVNPCSNAPNRYVEENNTAACPLTCIDCNGADKKCVNGVCLTGVRICYSSYFDPSIGMFRNFFHYVFSDGSTSEDIIENGWCDCDNANCL
jgi:YD repeat-containing protein